MNDGQRKPLAMKRVKRLVACVGFTLVEVMIAIGVIGITFIALYAAIASGFTVIQLARENLRATQILAEKMETVRLYNWDQVTSNGFIATNFTAPYFATNEYGSSGLTYTGTVSVLPAGFTETYNDDLRRVNVTLQWSSATVLRQRTMSTLVSRYGLQNYIY
jgi:prepilin-type N-terminal cleavage/methylation domain-containing protein